MLIVNTSEEYNGEGGDVLDKKINTGDILLETIDASLMCQNKILAKQFWEDKEKEKDTLVK